MSFLNDLTLSLILTRILAFLLIAGVHGLALALLLGWMGDTSPRNNGRQTANPFAHATTLGLAMAVFFEIFWVKPMKLGTAPLRWGRWSWVAAAAGALAVTLTLVPLLQAIRPLLIYLPRSAAVTSLNVLAEVQDVTIWFVALNWLPLPVLTGALFAYSAWPQLQRVYKRYQNGVTALLVIALVSGLLTPLVRPIHDTIAFLLVR